jgi:hypothetical protein
MMVLNHVLSVGAIDESLASKAKRFRRASTPLSG